MVVTWKIHWEHLADSFLMLGLCVCVHVCVCMIIKFTMLLQYIELVTLKEPRRSSFWTRDNVHYLILSEIQYMTQIMIMIIIIEHTIRTTYGDYKISNIHKVAIDDPLNGDQGMGWQVDCPVGIGTRMPEGSYPPRNHSVPLPPPPPRLGVSTANGGRVTSPRVVIIGSFR